MKILVLAVAAAAALSVQAVVSMPHVFGDNMVLQSAVAFFFGETHNKELGVPVGPFRCGDKMKLGDAGR